VAGRIGETPLQAAIRECHEELGDKAVFDVSKIEAVMDFIETATSDPNLKIHMYVFKYNGLLKGEISTSEEIEAFMWFGKDDNQDILSNTLRNETIPWAIKERYLEIGRAHV
jgi:8-oxo-dGTP pyrophosphatase MutT (NUDIX family)